MDNQILEVNPQRDAIKTLQAAMAKYPQLAFDTKHYFSDGMYMRWVMQPEGSLVVGKRHKKPHFFLLVKGHMRITSDGGMAQEYIAPALIVASAGAKRALLALEDSEYLTIHQTYETDLDCVEADCLEPEPGALFDSANHVKIDVAKFRELTKRVIADEKLGFWSDWNDEQKKLFSEGNWREFSKSRGYSEDEIKDYAAWMKMVAQALNAGLNPYVCISDLASEAAARNLGLDTKGEILKSSRLPFQQNWRIE